MQLWKSCLPGRVYAWAMVAVLIAPFHAEATEWVVAAGGTGRGTSSAPLGRIQEALDLAQPGDTVTVQAGTYAEALHTVRSGVSGLPIQVRAAGPRGSVLVTMPGRVLTVGHEYFVVEGVVLDGQYGTSDTVRVTSGGSHLIVRNVEVRRSTRDLIDIGAPQDVLIENSLIHHALNAANGRSDAHGIVAGAVRELMIRNTEIHTFSGDGVQLDPGRAAPGWNGVTIEGARIWLAPLPSAENGFAAGTVTGENAVDTKASAALPRSTIVVRDTVASGFRNGLIGNMAAFNLKENIDATIDGVTVFDSEIAFRLRGSSSPAHGAMAAVQNAVVYDVTTAFRYEDHIDNLRIWNTTIGRAVAHPFQSASSSASHLDVRNVLLLGTLRPAETADKSNLMVGPEVFVKAADDNYVLVAGSAPIDAGVSIAAVGTDRARVRRPQGSGYDVGAYEWQPARDAKVVPLTTSRSRRHLLPADRLVASIDRAKETR